MKILLINKYFYNRGGSERSFFDTASVLEKNGHSVMFFSMAAPENNTSLYEKYFVSNISFEHPKSYTEFIKNSTRLIYSVESRKKLGQLISDEKPDIVHLHNFHHHISPSIIFELKKAGLPIVMTLHDYKLVCPVYTLYNHGKPCELCWNRRFFHCIAGKCSKNSYLKSLLNTFESYLYGNILNIYSKIDSFISPSYFLKDKFASMGFKEPINVLYNFIEAGKYDKEHDDDDNSVIYYGRLSAEKGLMTLINAIKGLEINLKIYGTGPLWQQIEKRLANEKISNIKLYGFKERDDLNLEIKKSLFTIVPSEWYENNPMSIIESFALGKPVLGSRIGGIPELVKDNLSGLTFEPGNVKDLATKISYLHRNRGIIKIMGANAQKFVIENFNPQKYYESLMNIYENAI